MFKLWKEGVDGSFANAAPMFMEKGGGGYIPPPPPPDNTLAIRQMEIEQENRRAEREAAAKTAEAEERRRRAGSNLQRAYTGAQSFGRNQVNALGINDSYGLLDAYTAALEGARAMVPEGEENVGSYINPETLWTRTADQQRNAQRNRLRSATQGLYGQGFETNAFQDEADDTVLEDILGGQYEEAEGAVNRAKARGQLNDTAMGYATKALGTAKTSARNRLEDMGLGVLQRYRTNLANRGTAWNNRVQNWDFGDQLDLDSERRGFETDVNRFRNRMEGDVRGAIGDTELFDIDLLLGRAMNKGGSNAGTGGAVAPLASAFAGTSTDPNDPNNKRTVGNTGVF